MSYMKLKFYKSLDRTNMEFSAYIAAYVCFLTIFLFGKDEYLSSAIIIAALQPVLVLN